VTRVCRFRVDTATGAAIQPDVQTRRVAVRPWRTLRSQLVFEHEWYRLRRDTVELGDGSTIDDYFVSVRRDIALVVAVTPAREIVLVRQYKHGIGDVTLELPGGLVDDGETAEVAAARELLEETGYTAPRLQPLANYAHDPPKATNRIHGFLARDVAHTAPPTADPMEELEVVLVPLDEAVERVTREPTAAASVALVYTALEALAP
jgi:8-oxo-dGTP pyrophosphatase MutT (NUDIX family)